MQSNLLSRAPLFLVLALSACVTPPPDLPRDISSIDATDKLSEKEFNKPDLEKSCSQLSEEINEIAQAREELYSNVSEKRAGDQAAGFIGVLIFPPALLFVDQREGLSTQLNEIHKRLDTINQLVKFKGCSGTRGIKA
ncbi:hypothetical protein LPB19_16590 [Marinobacter salinisoli]|uniref:Uncharacterized protein n=1 Tax=Marinobacter salinisoli TaxID=2769486 RepID=A0ABX7MR75_9GAMM|nr:hypothetical protein [Marinobacter salinisoli]QSP94764.1 hypothetical protein LPB19_16590 [Marinobacter salinisoli]